MVVMSRQESGVRIPCVCGTARVLCRRIGHLGKQGIKEKTALPRYYTCDGRLDRMALTRSEGERMVFENRDEMERAAQALSSVEDDTDVNPVENVTLDRNQARDTRRSERAQRAASRRGDSNYETNSHGSDAANPSAEENDSDYIEEGSPEKGASLRITPDRVQQVYLSDVATQRRSNQGTLQEPRPVPKTLHTEEDDSSAPVEEWLGLEHPGTLIRIYTEADQGVIDRALLRGYKIQRVFKTLAAAEKWTSHNIEERRRANRPPVLLYRGPGTSERTIATPVSARHVSEVPQRRLENRATENEFLQQQRTTQQSESARDPEPSQNSNAVRHTKTTRRKEKHVVPVDESDDPDDSSVEVITAPRHPVPKPHKKKSVARDWYGLERCVTERSTSKCERAITNSKTQLRHLESLQYKLKELFATKAEAEHWLNKNLHESNGSGSGEESEASDTVHFSKKSKARKKAPVVLQSTPAVDLTITEEPKKTISLAAGEFFKAETAGEDPSIGNKEQIYGISHDDIEM